MGSIIDYVIADRWWDGQGVPLSPLMPEYLGYEFILFKVYICIEYLLPTIWLYMSITFVV